MKATIIYGAISFNNQKESLMQIEKFNPRMHATTFQQTIKSDAAEEVVKNAAFVALATNKPKILATGLSTDLVIKINHYIEERAKRITEFVLSLNALGNSRDKLLLSNPHYKESKEAFEEASKAYFTLNKLHPNFITEVKETFQMNNLELVTKRITKKATILTKYCDEQNPFIKLTDALSILDLQIKDEEEQKKNIDLLKQAIESCFLEFGFSFDVKRCIHNMDRHFTHEAEVTKILEEQVLSVREEEEKIRAKGEFEKTDQIETSKKRLLTSAKNYLSSHAELVKDSAYTRYLDEKKKIALELEELAGFCKFEELYRHPKMTNESNNRLNRMKSHLESVQSLSVSLAHLDLTKRE